MTPAFRVDVIRVHIPPVPIQLPKDTTGKVTEHSLMTWAPATHVGVTAGVSGLAPGKPMASC